MSGMACCYMISIQLAIVVLKYLKRSTTDSLRTLLI